MKGQGDLFKSGYLNNKPPEPKPDIFNILEIKPHDTAGIRGAVFAALQPIAREIKKEKLSPLAVAEGFYKMADEFPAEGHTITMNQCAAAFFANYSVTPK